jgi:hypothetical protein
MLSYRLKLPPPIGYGLLRKMRIRDSLLGEGLGERLTYCHSPSSVVVAKSKFPLLDSPATDALNIPSSLFLLE